MKQKIQVFTLKPPSRSIPKEKRRHRLKWRVDGREKSKSFRTKAEGERFRAQLQVAIAEGLPFDTVTLMPLQWTRSTATWWTWSTEWLKLKWPRWAGKTRKSGVESLLSFTPHLSRPGAPAPPETLVEWLWKVGYRPDIEGEPEASPESSWLERWSIPLDEIGPALLETALNSATTKRDGSTMAASVIRRRRNSLKTVLSLAVKRGLIPSNPMDRTEWTLPSQSLEVDVSTVASIMDVDQIVADVSSLKRGGARFAAFYATVAFAGMRPSEAAGLIVGDVELPETGWGLARLRGATTSPGTRYTSTGTTRESKGLKHRATDSVREVPLPPELVNRLRLHLDRWPPVDGHVFSNLRGRPVTADNYGPVWGRARARQWPEGHSLSSITVYDLRHTAATTMLRAGVMPSEVARRLGHSVDVLMRVYAGVFHDERDRSNALIDEEMNSQRLPGS